MYDFKKVEGEVAEFWKKKKTEEKTLKTNSKKKIFSFLDGPPTANAPPALHHLEVRTYKDVINRFRYMRGFSVPRKAGWDCHGLPVEVQIEKKLKLNSKKEILGYGEAKFIKEARQSVFEYIQAWNKSTEKLAYWVDLKNPYVTLDNKYIESVWWSLKELHKKKLLYEDYKVVPFCPRCETPLSSHEVALGYKKTTEDSVVAKFKLKGKDEYFLVWTTTPWTLPSNLAIAVNPDIDYVYVKENETYIVAKDLAKNFFENPKILKTAKGKQLLGVKYEPLMPYFRDRNAFVVVAGDFVTTQEGTGLVHLAPAFGEDDYEAIKKNKLPFVKPVDSNGKFTKEVPDYEGKFIKSADKEIIKDLKDQNKIFKIIKYEHDYPFCWRCSTPLMYYAIDSWFIKVSAYKKRLIELNEKINWVPSNIKEGRFGEWLRNVKDWALSRNKFWGTPLPVWRCASCKHDEIIGSIDELKKKSAKKLNDKEIDLHKPWIDGVKLKCSKCKKEMSRVSPVIDCWYDSGAASFAQFHYPFENKGIFKKRFPYDFISEAIDQTRGWFYTLHVLATILFDNAAYKNVICAGHIVDEKVDAGDSKIFGINRVKQDVLPFLNILWNTDQFYKQLDANEKAKINIEDRWILSKLNSTIKETTEALEKYKIEDGLKPIMNFVVNDFSRTYIKLIRDRRDKNAGKVIEECIDAVCRLLAPYAPYITEKIYSDMNKKSVHLAKWPKADGKKIDENLEKKFDFVLKIIETGLKERDNAQIGLRWPLKKCTVKTRIKLLGLDSMSDIIKTQLNVKNINFDILSEEDYSKSNDMIVEIDTTITPELEAEGYAREMSRQMQDFRKNLGLKKEEAIELAIFTDEEFAKILHSREDFLKNRTNSEKIIFFTDGFENRKEKFKNAVDFKIRDKRGKIATNW